MIITVDVINKIHIRRTFSITGKLYNQIWFLYLDNKKLGESCLAALVGVWSPTGRANDDVIFIFEIQ